jgi:hypothetical protein
VNVSLDISGKREFSSPHLLASTRFVNRASSPYPAVLYSPTAKHFHFLNYLSLMAKAASGAIPPAIACPLIRAPDYMSVAALTQLVQSDRRYDR